MITITTLCVVCSVFLVSMLKLYAVYKSKNNNVLVIEMERFRTVNIESNADVSNIAYSDNSLYNALASASPNYDELYSDSIVNTPTIHKAIIESVEVYDNGTIFCDTSSIHYPDIISGIISPENSVRNHSDTERSIEGNNADDDNPAKYVNKNNSIYNLSCLDGAQLHL